MCRSIKKLRREGDPASDEEVREAALQFVRKVSGYQKPSRANTEVFDAAVDEIAAASRRLLDAVASPRAPAVRRGGDPANGTGPAGPGK